MKISARNQLQGIVESVSLGAVMAEIVVRLNSGEHVVSAITAESANRLQLSPGKKVLAIIKSTEVMIGVEE